MCYYDHVRQQGITLLCYETHWTHLTNGLHILLFFPQLTCSKWASDSRGGSGTSRSCDITACTLRQELQLSASSTKQK